ncbi:hypothetical protein BKA70DRAFT_1095566 [Coprinopsis sp. MPI-PUGE-AT-0042]|nr:hypothetical protein BKA70DRAFT_1095566 [Coprinopsis sp. MPI-PUGE-AT-0042]
MDKGLTTATAHRLLRPLRTRANALGKLRAAPAQSVTTYSSSNRVGLLDITNQQQHDPLVVLPPPDKLASQLYFSQSDNKASLELARRIYALRDAFKNVVVKANLPVDRNTGSLIPLTALCALAIGHSLQEWEHPEGDASDNEDGDQSDGPSYADEMYEAVPAPYRAWLLVSHALGIILDTCPHHPTLICVLLDVVLMHRLESEASQLLEALFFLALRPKPNAQASICHPAHSKFLSEHLDKWLLAGFSVETFVSTLTSALSLTETVGAWVSKAMDTLARKLHHVHQPSLVWLATRLAYYASTHEESRCQLYKTLLRWMEMIDVPLDIPSNDVDRMVDFIRSANHGSNGDIQDSLACLASRLLLSSKGAASASQLDTLVKTLVGTQPRSSTFFSIVTTSIGVLASASQLQEGLKVLHQYADLFRSHDLAAHEASLWACTLTALENIEAGANPSDLGVVKRHRLEVMELVEQAECKFAPQGFDDLLSTPVVSRSVRRSPTLDLDDELSLVTPARRHLDEWKWEDDMNCWVRDRTLPVQTPASVLRPRITPKKATTAIPFNLVGSRRSRENGGCVKVPKLQFTSLVSNAVAHRTVLHRPTSKPRVELDKGVRGSGTARRVTFASSDDEEEDSASSAEEEADGFGNEPSSDVMDLFASGS